jgi:hypothetical protein
VHGGLYLRQPWFGEHDYHEPLPLDHDLAQHSVVLHGGAAHRSSVALLESVATSGAAASRVRGPHGKGGGVRISQGALLQMGFDYWRSPTMPYGSGGNNHEAGASNWYFLLISGRKPHSAIWEGHSSSGGAGPAPPGDDLIQFQVFAQNAYVLISSPGDIHDHNIRLLHSRCPLDDLGDGVS